MAVTPGTTSGTYGFALSNGEIIIEAFDRIGVRPQQLDRHHMMSARTSINLELLNWANIGFNLWKETSGTIDIASGTATYTMPTNLVTVTEVWYSLVNGLGSGINSDRIMLPMTRTQYAQLPNKLQQGTPTQFWYQMLAVPQITLWQVPAPGADAPTYVVNWYGLERMQDAEPTSGQTPDVVYRGLEALCARLSWRLAEKFAPARMAEKKELADAAFYDMQTRDQEMGPLLIQPQVGVYGRIY